MHKRYRQRKHTTDTGVTGFLQVKLLHAVTFSISFCQFHSLQAHLLEWCLTWAEGLSLLLLLVALLLLPSLAWV
jgi:hypothetical protein